MIIIYLIFFIVIIIGTESVYNGKPVKDISEYPSIVSIHQFDRHVCGGVILDDNHILTTANCVVYLSKKTKRNLKVLVGSVTQSGTSKFDVYKITHHENYNPNYPFDYNIAILKLKEKLELNSNVAKVNILEEYSKKCRGTFLGWGGTGESMGLPFDNSDDLNSLPMKTMTPKKCNRNSLLQIKLHHLCARHDNLISVIRFGDSGSPLFDEEKKLIGISCGPIDSLDYDIHPEIFTNVTHFSEWIEEIKKND